MAVGRTASGLIGVQDPVPQNGNLIVEPAMVMLEVGDSITDPDHPGGNYGATMRSTTDLAFTRRGLTPPTWINTGEAGDTTDNLKDHTADRITDYEPDGVIIFIGVNDSSFTVQETADNYNSILDDIAAAGIKRVLCATPWLHFHATLAARCDAIAAIACERGFPLVHHFRRYVAEGNPAGLDSDGTHPTAAGKIWLSNNVLRHISPAY